MNRKNGVSGFMRVKNDAEFVAASIDSCIDALDELIIVYNECTDSSPDIIENKRLEYPEKIKVYEYKYKVYSVNLTKKDYEYALNLSDDSPELLCNYYNFALSKVSYKYALKIDADQIYFTDSLRYWCDLFRIKGSNGSVISYVAGLFFNLYFIFYKKICLFSKRVYSFLLPVWLIKMFYPSYIEYVKHQIKNDKACLSLSGLNVFYDIGWYVSLGKKSEIMNILPPFNGEGDHLIFKVSNETYFRRFEMPYYNALTNTNYSLIEEFVQPYKVLCGGFAWFHMNAMRNRYKDKVLYVKQKCGYAFVKLSDLFKLKYEDLLCKSDKEMFSLRQRVLFNFIYKSDVLTIKRNICVLKNLTNDTSN